MAKLCSLLSSWPAGVVGVQPWLQDRKIYRQLSNHYAANGWLKKIGSGAYVRAGENVTWQGGVYALQQGLNLSVHVGGLSSLELLGSSHFIPMGKDRRLYIYAYDSDVPRHLPKWFLDLEGVTTEYTQAQLFSSTIGLIDFNCASFSIKISSPERAIFELLSLVPNKATFEHACLLMQYQRTLRADVVQKLLEGCNSQILKRLFLYLARKFSLDCIQRLNLKSVDLGRGPRHVGQAEVFDQELNLYVPKMSQDLDPDQEVPDV